MANDVLRWGEKIIVCIFQLRLLLSLRFIDTRFKLVAATYESHRDPKDASPPTHHPPLASCLSPPHIQRSRTPQSRSKTARQAAAVAREQQQEICCYVSTLRHSWLTLLSLSLEEFTWPALLSNYQCHRWAIWRLQRNSCGTCRILLCFSI